MVAFWHGHYPKVLPSIVFNRNLLTCGLYKSISQLRTLMVYSAVYSPLALGLLTDALVHLVPAQDDGDPLLRHVLAK